MSLGIRDRVKINAALAAIFGAGHDPAEVTKVAEASINIGTPARKAYERAFNLFTDAHPEYRADFMRLGQLIDATDNRTVASYSVALDRYVESGDRAHMDAILPTIEQDLRAMAATTGDAGFVDGLEPPEPTPAAPASPSGPGWDATGYRPNEAKPATGEHRSPTNPDE